MLAPVWVAEERGGANIGVGEIKRRFDVTNPIFFFKPVQGNREKGKVVIT